MSNKLDDLFELPSNDDIEKIRNALHAQNDKIEKDAEETDELGTEMTPLAQQALTQITDHEDRVNQIIDLEKFDEDTDDLFNESMLAFREILSIAKDLPAPSMGKAFESAAIFARLALDAKNSKIKIRLDAISLALKKQQMDNKKTEKDTSNETIDATGNFLDRNQLLAHIKEELDRDKDIKD
jgi:hypothetical protein